MPSDQKRVAHELAAILACVLALLLGACAGPASEAEPARQPSEAQRDGAPDPPPSVGQDIAVDVDADAAAVGPPPNVGQDAAVDVDADAALVSGDAAPDSPCADADDDGICDSDDVCPDGDDTLDRDVDGMPDACEVALPVEVMGPGGTQVAVRIALESAAAATHLYLRCHACGYRDRALDGAADRIKAGLRINGGPLVALKRYTGGEGVVGNAELRLLGAAEAYGGIGGGFHTVEMVLPVDGLVDGENVLVFEHVYAVPPSMGFRIIDLDVLRSADPGDGLLGDTDRVYDNPAWWERPVADSPAAREGARLWSRPGLYDPTIDLLDGADDGVGTASCASCHATDGRDLQYFNYSDHSIIERAVFHGLTREEGTQIAAYVRSRGVELVPGARPWNPPYQPGPGLDARPVHEWAAGAGLGSVLRDDAEMESFLFASGTDPEAVAAVVDRFGTLNMRELPISLQFPDWNAWLPALHPADALDLTQDAVRADEDGALLDRPFWDALYASAAADPTPENLGNLVTRLSAWLGRDATCFSQSLASGPGWRAGDGVVARSAVFGASRLDPADCAGTRHDPERTWGVELAKRSVVSWATVRQWELMHGRQLEQASAGQDEAVCAGSTCVSAAEPRGWVTRGAEQGMNVFTRAPHYIGYRPESFTFQSELVGTYESTAWYHLQLVLNPGYRRTAPSHFVYTIQFVEALQRLSGVSQSFRFWAGMIKQRQQQTNGDYGVEAGLDLRTAQPHYYYADRRGRTEVRAGVGDELWRSLVAALLVDLVEDAANATPADWAAANQNRVVQQPDSGELEPCTAACWESTSLETAPFTNGAYQGRNTLRVLPRYRELGVDEAALDALIDWSATMWPLGDWESLRAAPDAPEP